MELKIWCWSSGSSSSGGISRSNTCTFLSVHSKSSSSTKLRFAILFSQVRLFNLGI